MRVTFVLPQADLSGGVRVVATYAARLARRGHDVTIMSLPRRRPTLRERARSILRNKSLPRAARHLPNHLEGLAGVEHRVIEQHRPVEAGDVPDGDVVIATWWQTAEWVAQFPAGKGAKVHFVQGHEVLPGQPVDRVEASYRLPMRKICVARWLADVCRERGDASAVVVPNAVDLEQFKTSPRSKLAVPTAGLMYATPWLKGCDVSLEAFELARRQRPELELVAFGSRPVDPALPLPAGARYTVRPPQDRIKDVYAAADVWLFGTRKEGFGLPILEAMACRTPVIGTPAGAAPELLEQGGGILVPMEDPRAMADAILKVCSMNAADWRALSDAAHANAIRYTWDDAADQFEAALVGAVEAARLNQPQPAGV